MEDMLVFFFIMAWSTSFQLGKLRLFLKEKKLLLKMRFVGGGKRIIMTDICVIQ